MELTHVIAFKFTGGVTPPAIRMHLKWFTSR